MGDGDVGGLVSNVEKHFFVVIPLHVLYVVSVTLKHKKLRAWVEFGGFLGVFWGFFGVFWGFFGSFGGFLGVFRGVLKVLENI